MPLTHLSFSYISSPTLLPPSSSSSSPLSLSPTSISTLPILPPFPSIVQGYNSNFPTKMMLRAPPFTPTTTAAAVNPAVSKRTGLGIGPGPVYGVSGRREKSNGYAGIVAAVQEANTMTGIVFQPFEEVKSDNFMVPISPQVSLARQKFGDQCESAINEQINVEYSASYVYHSLFAYFDRDNVALKGFAKFFKESSEEEREHAEKLMEYQNMRGGKVKLHSILMPPSDFEHAEKGDALYAMELALSLEKLVNEKLLNLHTVAGENNDPQLQDFVEGEFLSEQVDAIKKISEYVTQLRMIGKGHGVWHFDQMLLQ